MAQPSAAERYEYVPLTLVHPSETNPRHFVDDDALAELAADIKEHGIIEPLIVVDQGKAGYEIVAGERRWRAAGLAGLADVPVVVKGLGDEERFLVRLCENLQREDLSPLDLAAGYRKLLDEFHWTADQVAEKVHKKRRHIFATMALLHLKGDSKKALASGRMNASVGTLLARVAPPRREAAFKALVDETLRNSHQYELKPAQSIDVTVRQAERVLRDFIGTPLAGVSWKLDDTSLPVDWPPAQDGSLPREGEWSCLSCPFNTRNVPDLVEVYDGADVCTLAACFRGKEKEQYRRDSERWAEKGAKVLTLAESKQLTHYGHFSPEQKGYAPLTGTPMGSNRNTTYGEILKGKDDVQVYVARGPKGGEVKLVKVAEVKDYLRAAGVHVAERHVSRPSPQQSAADKAAREAAKAIEEEASSLAVRRVHEHMPGVKQTVALVPLLIRAGRLIDGVLPDAVRDVRELGKLDYSRTEKWLAKIEGADLFNLFVETLVADSHPDVVEEDGRDAILAFCGLPTYAALMKDARKVAAAQLATAGKPAPKKKPAAKKAKVAR